MAPGHEHDDGCRERDEDTRSVSGDRDGSRGLLPRRGYLKLAGTAVASATALGAAGSASAAEYRTVTVPAGGSRRFSVGSGETLENVLIDVSAPGADVFITGRGSGWTIRNVGVRGAFDVGSDNNVLDSSYGGGFHQVMNCSGRGVIENVYLGDGCVEGCDRSAMNVGNDHGGHIEMRRCNVGRWSSNAIYAAGFGRRRPPGKTDGAGGTIAFRDCYFHDNNVAHLRLAADGTEVENCTLHNTNSVPVLPLSNGGARNVVNSRGIYTGYGDPGQTITVSNCDFDITSANTNGAASAVVSGNHPTYGDLTTVRIVDSQVRGDLVGGQVETQNVGSNPDTSAPAGVPMDAVAAASGGGSTDGGTQPPAEPPADDGSDGDEQALPNALSVSGGGVGNLVSYSFEASGAVEKSTARSATIDDDDAIDGSAVTGTVAGGVDSYRFGGDVAAFDADGDVTVHLNGQRVDPASLGGGSGSSDPESDDGPPDAGDGSPGSDDGSSESDAGPSGEHTLTIRGGGPGNLLGYAFRVSGDLRKSDAGGASIDSEDSIYGTRAMGRVAGGADSYRFTGTVTGFIAADGITVSLDGRRVAPGDLLG